MNIQMTPIVNQSLVYFQEYPWSPLAAIAVGLFIFKRARKLAFATALVSAFVLAIPRFPALMREAARLSPPDWK